MSASPHLRLEREGCVARLVLARPPLNVLNLSMMAEMDEALRTVECDPTVSVLVLTGEGKAFCAGVDVADHTADRVGEMIRLFHGVLLRMMAMECPVVAAVNGAALGGGCELVMATDIVLARAGAKLAQPEIRLGVFPPIAAALLPRLIGRQGAMDLILSGRTILAEEAQRVGLVNLVIPPDDFAGGVAAYVDGLAALSRPVLRLTKAAILQGLGVPLRSAVEGAEKLYLDDLMALDDPHEGLAAFMEKRAPAWKGA